MLLLLPFDSDLLPDLLLNLLKCLQKELLNLTSLIEDDLSQGPDILELLVLDSQSLSASDDVFLLIVDDLIMLELQQLFLFLKVAYNVLE